MFPCECKGTTGVQVTTEVVRTTNVMLQVSSDASGRGVLRLIRLHSRLNLLNVLAIGIELFILSFPSWVIPTQGRRRSYAVPP